MSAVLRSRSASIALRALLLLGLAWFYYAGATQHAEKVNWFKARGDQSGYLYDAQVLYRNWHGLNDPPQLVHRNRMPLYGAYQAVFWDPKISNDEFFVVAKHRNIVLSLVLLVLLAVLLAWHLRPLAATNLTLVIAFGYFVFKAGYVQSELLFYFLFFTTFLACWHVFRARRAVVMLTLSALAGVLGALAHLTKAAMLPFGALYSAIWAGVAVIAIARRRDWRSAARTAAVALAFWVTFLLVLSPYLLNSKRVFGHYFYNVNSTFYVWYDNWPQASTGTYVRGDHERWPDMPERDLPGARRYLREHSVGQIAARIRGGFKDMVVRSYTTYWYFKFVVLYVGFFVLLLATQWRAMVTLFRAHGALVVFLAFYGGLYLVMTAFYEPISGTGTARFLLAHVAPLLFALSRLFERFPSRGFHVLVAITLALDLAFVLWPRLMTTYGGF